MKRGGMGTYKLSENAKEDLKRIYRRGLLEFGEAQADEYYHALFDRFEQIGDYPLLYPAVEEVVEIMAVLGRQDVEGWL